MPTETGAPAYRKKSRPSARTALAAPMFQAPDWIDRTADTVTLFDPVQPVACTVCGTTRLVWGRYTRKGPGKPRLLRTAYCIAHLPREWYRGSAHAAADQMRQDAASDQLPTPSSPGRD